MQACQCWIQAPDHLQRHHADLHRGWERVTAFQRAGGAFLCKGWNGRQVGLVEASYPPFQAGQSSSGLLGPTWSKEISSPLLWANLQPPPNPCWIPGRPCSLVAPMQVRIGLSVLSSLTYFNCQAHVFNLSLKLMVFIWSGTPWILAGSCPKHNFGQNPE